MEYKGFTIAVTVAYQGSSTVGAPVYATRCDGALVDGGAVQDKFADETATEDAAYTEARQWIDAKC